MAIGNRRIARERQTLETMLKMYCHDCHGPAEGLCEECGGLQAYALDRLERCPFKTDKPTCFKCPVHCYRPEMREQIRDVMRHAGPRMLMRHPILAVLHMLDSSAGTKSIIHISGKKHIIHHKGGKDHESQKVR